MSAKIATNSLSYRVESSSPGHPQQAEGRRESARRPRRGDDGPLPGKDGSPATLDGWIRLACGVLAEAVSDLRSSDPIIALDALGWWLDEAPIWLDAVELDEAPDLVFYSVLLTKRGKNYDRQKPQPKLLTG